MFLGTECEIIIQVNFMVISYAHENSSLNQIYRTLQQSFLVVLWSTQRLSTFMSTQRISQHVDIIFNISTKEQWKNRMSIIT